MASFKKRGDRQWQVRIRRKDPGTGEVNYLSKTFETKGEAEDWASTVETDMRKGAWVSSKEAESCTLAECLDRFQEEYFPRLKSPRQEVGRVNILKKYPLSKRIMSTIRSGDLANFRKAREAEGCKPDTIRLDFALISRVFNYARSDWGMESLTNPVQIASKPKLPGGRTRRLVGDEETRLLAAASPELRPIIILAVETAMRRGEIVGLRWENIDLKRRIAKLDDTKNGTSRTVPLSIRAMEILDGLPRNIKGEVFGLRPDSIDKMMARACKAAGIEGLRFHDLRHEATSRFFEKTDLDALEISRITGHKSMQMLSRYSHLRTADLVHRLDGRRRGESRRHDSPSGS